jgi:hypothetical protein
MIGGSRRCYWGVVNKRNGGGVLVSYRPVFCRRCREEIRAVNERNGGGMLVARRPRSKWKEMGATCAAPGQNEMKRNRGSKCCPRSKRKERGGQHLLPPFEKTRNRGSECCPRSKRKETGGSVSDSRCPRRRR